MNRLCALALFLLISMPAAAGTAYKCSAADGRVVYQDKPCASNQRQETVQLDDSQPLTSLPPSQPPAAEATTAPPPTAPPPAQPAEPMPVLYSCIRATDSETYLTEQGNPQPYQVPYGVLGASSLPLSKVYGAPNGAGASAPELNRNPIKAAFSANTYVWVQDRCHALTYQETCRALRDEFDDNATKLRRAFKSDQPPLEQREKQLLAQLRNC